MARTVDPARHEARRLQIVESAARCFASTGFDATTTADICRAAGIGSGTLFHYFGTKRAILHAIFALDAAEQAARGAAALASADPLGALWTLIDQLAAYARERDFLGLVFEAIRQVGRDPVLAELIGGSDRSTRDTLAELLSRCHARGEADASVDPQTAAGWVHAIVDSLYLRVAGDPTLPVEAEIAVMRTVIARFLRCEPPSAPPRPAA